MRQSKWLRPIFQVRDPGITVPEHVSGKDDCGSQASARPGSVTALWAVLWATVGQPGGLRLTIRCRKQLRAAQARSARPILPPCRLCQNTRAGSCFFSHFKNIQCTCVYSAAEGCAAPPRRAAPSPRRRGPSQTTSPKRPPPGSSSERPAGGCLRASGLEQCSSLCKQTAPTVI